MFTPSLSRKVKYLLFVEARHRLRRRCHKKQLQVLNSARSENYKWLTQRSCILERRSVHIHLENKKQTLKNTQLNLDSEKGSTNYHLNKFLVNSQTFLQDRKHTAILTQETVTQKTQLNLHSEKERSIYHWKKFVVKKPCMFERKKIHGDIDSEKTRSKIHHKFKPCIFKETNFTTRLE